jgi:hypothetical protein
VGPRRASTALGGMGLSPCLRRIGSGTAGESSLSTPGSFRRARSASWQGGPLAPAAPHPPHPIDPPHDSPAGERQLEAEKEKKGKASELVEVAVCLGTTPRQPAWWLPGLQPTLLVAERRLSSSGLRSAGRPTASCEQQASELSAWTEEDPKKCRWSGRRAAALAITAATHAATHADHARRHRHQPHHWGAAGAAATTTAPTASTFTSAMILAIAGTF